MNAAEPLVSVVMPSLNQAAYIGEAVASVLGQDHRNLELVVADGGSSDGTVLLLRQLAGADRRLRWFSKSDSGTAQAVNRALNLALGTIIGWLNSDDVYTPGAVRRAVAGLDANPEWLMLYGNARHMDAAGVVLGDYPTLGPSAPVARFEQGCFICQPTVFFRRSMWRLLGDLDESLKAAFDFEYWLRAFLAFQARVGFVHAVQAHSRLHAESITQRQRRAIALEGMQVLARHLGRAPKEWFMSYQNELLALPAGRRPPGDLVAHLIATLDEARPWLREEDTRQLESHLRELPRHDPPRGAL